MCLFLLACKTLRDHFLEPSEVIVQSEHRDNRPITGYIISTYTKVQRQAVLNFKSQFSPVPLLVRLRSFHAQSEERQRKTKIMVQKYQQLSGPALQVKKWTSARYLPPIVLLPFMESSWHYPQLRRVPRKLSTLMVRLEMGKSCSYDQL